MTRPSRIPVSQRSLAGDAANRKTLPANTGSQGKWPASRAAQASMVAGIKSVIVALMPVTGDKCRRIHSQSSVLRERTRMEERVSPVGSNKMYLISAVLFGAMIACVPAVHNRSQHVPPCAARSECVGRYYTSRHHVCYPRPKHPCVNPGGIIIPVPKPSVQPGGTIIPVPPHQH
jgi:hypothetical protein